jgi:trk system potassium uptake protein TrkA
MQIIIIGCGKVGSALAGELVAAGQDVVIVDSDPVLIRNADSVDCIKITGVPIDRDILRQAGIETADVLCATTQNDNINIMVAQIAREIFTVPRIIARIFNPANSQVFEAFNLETICQTSLTVNAFLRKIAGEKSETLHRVFDTDIIYTLSPPDDSLDGEEVAKLAADSGKLIIGLLRNGRLLLTLPGLRVQKGDELVLAAIGDRLFAETEGAPV